MGVIASIRKTSGKVLCAGDLKRIKVGLRTRWVEKPREKKALSAEQEKELGQLLAQAKIFNGNRLARQLVKIKDLCDPYDMPDILRRQYDLRLSYFKREEETTPKKFLMKEKLAMAS
jgi:hypothetical protein